MSAGDFLEELEGELDRARVAAAAAVDRCEALVALRSRALAVAEGLGGVLRVEDVFESDDEEEAAQLRALAGRIVGDDG
jgi:hypothetical protein